jgi:SAM-dependent methyltransferase
MSAELMTPGPHVAWKPAEIGCVVATEEHAIALALRSQVAITDAQFDTLYPTGHRFRSYNHWTPVEVAARACALLAPQSGECVLDIGSGVGKLCLVGALTTQATWVGVETEAQMIRVAEAAARRLRVGDRVRFMHADATEIDWSGFAAIYMFNPFAEGLLGARTNAAAHDRFSLNIERTRSQLARTRVGTRLVTYHGFGGQVPAGFELAHDEPARQDRLCLWVRRA